MEPITSLIDRIKGFAKSGERFVNGAIRKCSISSNHDSIELLKRLQREAFSDLMKLRDRVDKTERILSLYKTSKGGPFQEPSTHMKGIVEVVGASFFVENDDQLACTALDIAGIKTGIDLRFIFKTALRQKDQLVAEFSAGQNSLTNNCNIHGNPLALEKLTYLAGINDSLSVIATPLGAQCNDYGVASNFGKGRCLGKISSFVPSLFSQCHNCSAGVMVKGSNVSASLAELVSEMDMPPNAAGSRSLSTYGQVSYQPFEEERFTFSFLWQKSRPLSHLSKFGQLAIPVGHLKRRRSTDVKGRASSSDSNRKVDGISSESIAVMLESELETTNLSGWVELQKTSANLLQWGVSFSDIPEDELGWGLRTGGKIERHSNQLQLEGFLNFSFGKKLSLQPGLVHAMDGKKHTTALVFRSSWFM